MTCWSFPSKTLAVESPLLAKVKVAPRSTLRSTPPVALTAGTDSATRMTLLSAGETVAVYGAIEVGSVNLLQVVPPSRERYNPEAAQTKTACGSRGSKAT